MIVQFTNYVLYPSSWWVVVTTTEGGERLGVDYALSQSAAEELACISRIYHGTGAASVDVSVMPAHQWLARRPSERWLVGNALPIGVLAGGQATVRPISQSAARALAADIAASYWGHSNSLQAVADWLAVPAERVTPAVERPSLRPAAGGVELDGHIYTHLLVVTPVTTSRPQGELSGVAEFQAFVVMIQEV